MVRNRGDYVQKWIKDNYVRLAVWVEPDFKRRVIAAAAAAGLPLRQYVIIALREKMRKKP